MIPAAALQLVLMAQPVFAKIPAPDLTPEAKAKVAEAAAKTAWAGKVASFKLCQSQDKVAAMYRASAAAAGKTVPTPACANPGPFAYAPAVLAANPIEASGAHSPAATAASPPSTNLKASEVNPAPGK
jgi:hypothetical protein